MQIYQIFFLEGHYFLDIQYFFQKLILELVYDRVPWGNKKKL